LITHQEWDWLRKGLAALPAERLAEISREIASLARQAQRPIICPLLDKVEGVCLVYLHRPIACRTYGFYLQRGQGLYCKDIESRVTEGAWSDVVWGNQDVIDSRLSTQGDARELTEWYQEWSEH
jgi:Fe-S-cluster containining protein